MWKKSSKLMRKAPADAGEAASTSTAVEAATSVVPQVERTDFLFIGGFRRLTGWRSNFCAGEAKSSDYISFTSRQSKTVSANCQVNRRTAAKPPSLSRCFARLRGRRDAPVMPFLLIVAARPVV